MTVVVTVVLLVVGSVVEYSVRGMKFEVEKVRGHKMSDFFQKIAQSCLAANSFGLKLSIGLLLKSYL